MKFRKSKTKNTSSDVTVWQVSVLKRLPKKTIIFAVVLILLISAGAIFVYNQHQVKDNAKIAYQPSNELLASADYQAKLKAINSALASKDVSAAKSALDEAEKQFEVKNEPNVDFLYLHYQIAMSITPLPDIDTQRAVVAQLSSISEQNQSIRSSLGLTGEQVKALQQAVNTVPGLSTGGVGE